VRQPYGRREVLLIRMSAFCLAATGSRTSAKGPAAIVRDRRMQPFDLEIRAVPRDRLSAVEERRAGLHGCALLLSSRRTFAAAGGDAEDHPGIPRRGGPASHGGIAARGHPAAIAIATRLSTSPRHPTAEPCKASEKPWESNPGSITVQAAATNRQSALQCKGFP
jgi:hypothetical protein